ncbi:BHLH domain-containing protein [Mycena indigotica]|uniref:BHLH domain-containing protein n=1 Tax=Mycena indigotica TaxID=2126181 RepID=A0A8H6W3E0_9AGAR|nr:BHLH domain-containing protein [Mycena indigotica]KAF7304154.1 BHLH domain-containing protein [Mycena indigotica]
MSSPDETPVARGRSQRGAAGGRNPSSARSDITMAGESGSKQRKRARTFTADDRMNSGGVEKQKRETLNALFVDLARLTPSLSTTRKLSESVILTEAIAHSRKQRAQRLVCAQELRKMFAIQENILDELNELRKQLGLGDRELDSSFGLSAAAKEAVFTVEGEVFGEFSDGFGERSEPLLEERPENAVGNTEPPQASYPHRQRLTSRSVSVGTTVSEWTPSTSTSPPEIPATAWGISTSPTNEPLPPPLQAFDYGEPAPLYDGHFLSMLSTLPEPPYGFHPQEGSMAPNRDHSSMIMDDLGMSGPSPIDTITAAGSAFPAPEPTISPSQLQNVPNPNTQTHSHSNPLLLDPTAWKRFLSLSQPSLGSQIRPSSTTQSRAAGVGAGVNGAPELTVDDFAMSPPFLGMGAGAAAGGHGAMGFVGDEPPNPMSSVNMEYPPMNPAPLVHLGTHGGFVV